MLIRRPDLPHVQSSTTGHVMSIKHTNPAQCGWLMHYVTQNIPDGTQQLLRQLVGRLPLHQHAQVDGQALGGTAHQVGHAGRHAAAANVDVHLKVVWPPERARGRQQGRLSGAGTAAPNRAWSSPMCRELTEQNMTLS